jgi:hypothetical protein
MPVSLLPQEQFSLLPGQVPSGDQARPVGFPVLALQATFIDGGLILSFSIQHSVVDGASIYLILETLAESIRNHHSPGHFAPYESPDLSRYYKDQLDTKEATSGDGSDHESKLPPTFPEWDFGETKVSTASKATNVTKILRIPASTIQALKEKVMIALGGRATGKNLWVSKVDCLSALLWVAILGVRLPRLDPEVVSKFTTAVDVRGKLDPPLPSTYFGNMIVNVVAESKIGILTGQTG